MTELREFISGSSSDETIEQFKTGEEKTPAFNKASVKNMAAKATALSDNPNLTEVLKQVDVEFEENGGSETAVNIVQDAKARRDEREKKALVQRIGRGDVALEDRKHTAESFVKRANEFVNENMMIAEEAAVDDSSPFIGEDEDRARVNVTKALKEVDDYRAFVQKKINHEASKNNTAFLSNMADFIELLVPFTEQAAFGKLSAQLRSGDPVEVAKGFALLGKNKAKLRDWFASFPPEKRQELIPHVIAMVRNSDTVVMSETNDFMRNEFLRSIIDVGYYGEGSEILDNIASVLDLVGAGFLVKGFKGTSKVGKTVRATDPEPQVKDPLKPDLDENVLRVKEVDAADFVTFPDEKGGLKKGRSKVTIDAEDVSNQKLLPHIDKKVTRSNVQPQSVSQVIKDVNPQKSRVLHAAASTAKSDEMAQTLYGTTKTEAVVNDLLPEIDDVNTTSKLNEPDALIAQLREINEKTTELDDIKRYVNAEQGAIYYTEKEKKAARSKVLNDFQNVTGLNARKEMFKWGTKADGASVKGVYGPQDGGFADGNLAMETAKIALREYGIDDTNVSLLKRQGDNYVPVEKGDDLTDGDFLIQVDYRYKFRPNDIAFEGGTDVKRNIFDRVPFFRSTQGQGSLMSHILDAASMLNPLLTKGAAVQIDKSARLRKLLGDVTKELEEGFSKLPKDRQNILSDLWKEANYKEFHIDNTVAAARGLTEDEKVLSDMWREVWDTIWELENRDLKQTIQAQGYRLFSDQINDSNLFVKIIPEGQLRGKPIRAYDSETNTIRQFTQQEVDEALDAGAEFGRTKTPIDVDGDTVSRVFAPNKANTGYIRAINDNDAILNYRKGYYQVHYKDPHFIEEKIILPNGEVKWRAKATAKNKSEADVMTASLASKTGREYRNRLDRNQTTLQGDDAWETIISKGRSAQRVRGERLEDAAGADDFASAHIMDPAEALSQSINSISQRVEMRDWIESAKARLLQTKSNVMPKDEKGRAVYPTDPKQIGLDGGSRKDAADAATIWEYIRAMEDGYTNFMDDSIRGIWHGMADMFGGRNNILFDKVEEFGRRRGSGLGTTGFAKKKAFQMYLALNPLRQVIVQSHQLIQIAHINPTYLVTKLAPEMAILNMSKYVKKGDKAIEKSILSFAEKNGITPAELIDMRRHWENSGLKFAVDTNNLVRDDWLEANRTGDFINKLGRGFDKISNVGQKIGFDVGERANVQSAWLTFRHRAIKEGRDMNDPAVADDVAAQARNYTYNMNRAGDLPYNSNWLGTVMQFMQVPVKATTQVLFNRTLSKRERAQIGIGNTLLYGVPGLYIAQNMFGDLLPDDEVQREIIVRGIESLVLNKSLEMATGDDVDIDWTTIAPWDAHGVMDTIHTLFTSGLSEAIYKAPSVQMLKDGGKVHNLLSSASRYFGVARDFNEPTTFSRVAIDFAKIASGFSNAFKAEYALRTNRAFQTYDKPNTRNIQVSTTEAILQAFGFRTLEEATAFSTSVKLSQSYKERKNDFDTWYKEYKRHMSAEGKPEQYYENVQDTFNEAFRVFPNDKLTHEFLNKALRRDIKNNDITFYKRVMNNAQWMDHSKLNDIIRENHSMTEEQKKEMISRLEEMRNYGRNN